MVDRKTLAFKIDCAPTQPDRFTAAQSVKRCDDHAKLQNIALYFLKQTVKLLLGIETRLKDALFRTFDFIRGIAVNCTDPKSVFPFISSYLTNSKAETHRFK